MRCIGALVLRDAVHIVCGDSAGGTLKQAGLRVLVDRDVLAIGPCDPDPVRNDELRHAFWREEWRLAGWPKWPGWKRMRWPRGGKVVLWTSCHLPDRLMMWRALEALRSRDVQLHVAEAAPMVGILYVDEVAQVLDKAVALIPADIRRGAGMWSLWSAGDLGTLSRWLEPVLRELVHGYLPGAGPRLSWFDRALLEPFDTWATPLSGIKQRIEKLMVFGDLVLLTRIRRWIDAGALVSRLVPGKSAWTDRELRLTPNGKRLLRGLRSLDEAPPLWLGGHEVYGPGSWCITRSGRPVRASSPPA